MGVPNTFASALVQAHESEKQLGNIQVCDVR